jgi:hypothetical protein
VPDRELRGDECAEAVPEHRGAGPEVERGHDGRDVIGVIGDRLELDRRRASESRQVDAGHAARRRERPAHAVEHGEVGQQRMDEQQPGPLPAWSCWTSISSNAAGAMAGPIAVPRRGTRRTVRDFLLRCSRAGM